MKKFLCLALAAMTIALCSCSSEQTGETGETTEYLESETEVETTVLDTYQEFLDGVTYLNFELGEQNSPTFVGRWFEKKINGEIPMMTARNCQSVKGIKHYHKHLLSCCERETLY